MKKMIRPSYSFTFLTGVLLAAAVSACRTVGSQDPPAGPGDVQTPEQSLAAENATMFHDALCPPQTDANLVGRPSDFQDFEHILLAYLNTGGKPQTLQPQLSQSSYAAGSQVVIMDMNADGVDEITYLGRVRGSDIPQSQGGIIVFYCEGGQYRAQTVTSGYYLFDPAVAGVLDLDRDGKLEIVFRYVNGGSTCKAGIAVVKFAGLQIVNRFPDSVSTPYCEFNVDFADVDYDGVMEVLVSGRTGEIYSRAVTYTYAQDENGRYAIKSVETAASSLRIHVLEDAQAALDRGDYPLAAQHYAQAAYSRSLQDIVPLNAGDLPTIAYLTAFAAFRLAAIYLVQGNDARGAEVLERIVRDYPEGSPGSEFAALTRQLIEEFALDRSPEETCTSVTRTIMAQYPALTDALGDWGLPALSFRPQTICPFYVEES